MKLISTIICPIKLDEMKRIADLFGGHGITISSVMGCGTQKGQKNNFKGISTEINLLPKIKVEMYVDDEQVEPILDAIYNKISTGTIGDGKVAIIDIEDMMRIRTGERGKKAI